MTVEISLDAVLERVRRLTEYIGAKSGAYEQVRAIKSDSGQLEVWFDEAVAEVSNVADRLLTSRAREEDGTWTLDLRVSNRKQAEAAEAAVRCVAGRVLCCWLMVAAPEAAETYMRKQAALLDEFARLVYYRDMPL